MDYETWKKIVWIMLTGAIFTVISFLISLALESWNVKAHTRLDINCNYQEEKGTYEEVATEPSE